MSLNASLLGALRCFEVAARHCNFTRAAAELNLTPGAVSQQIRQLEQRLGQPLFRRLPRGLALTDAALDLYQACQEAFGRLEQACQRLGQGRPPLTLSCTPTFAMMWLMPRMQAFHALHPGIEIRMVAEFDDVGMAALRSRGIDLAIRYKPLQMEAGERLLMHEWLLPVGAPGGNWEEAPRLYDSSAWAGAARDEEWRAWLRASGQVSLAHGGEQEFSLFMLASSAAQRGQGVAMGRLAMVLDGLQRGELAAASPLALPSPAGYCLLAPEGGDARVAALTSWLLQAGTACDEACRAALAAGSPARTP
ncbi:LysR family transcriptional regulator [Bordetella trematum]|uniref:LysR family transcriptional regulator n=1 Tax=Bordetella trematum TaxID=123899 RepID=UPI003AF33342